MCGYRILLYIVQDVAIFLFLEVAVCGICQQRRIKRQNSLYDLYKGFASFFNFKETPSQEKHKTSFGVLTTIELNLRG